jgi:hypothetical protein
MEFLRVKSSRFYYLRNMGQMVPPVAKIGRSLRFHPAEVKAWVLAGSPSLDEWEGKKRRNPGLFDREKF